MKQPLVSVVMPSYNHREFVGRAIESVLAQTYKNFEFIIADDGSTDDSPELIKQYDDCRIKFIRFEQNSAFGAYEYGLELAQGDYIATIASDDMWDETLLEKYVEFLENNSDYGCCFCQPKIIDEKDNIIENSERYDEFKAENKTKEEWFRQLFLQGNCICAPSMCIRKSVYDKVGIFRFQYRQIQDYEYWLRMVQVSNLYIYPEKLIKYRVHDEGNNKNISAPTKETIVRGKIERKYILLDMMENMEDEFFLKAFVNELMLSPDREGFCIECEKFGVLLKSSMPDPAIYYYFKHYNNPKFRNSMETYYHITRKAFWNFTGVDHDQWYENLINKYKVEELMYQVAWLKQQLSEKEEKVCEKKLVMKHLGLRLTSYCNLNCKDCADLIPKQKNCHYDYNLLIEDMNKVLSVVNFIQEILLIGGEVFLYPHMEEIIDYCAKSPKIGKIIITTNGTMIPSEKLIQTIKDNKVIMRVSGYEVDVAPKRAELIQKIKEQEIPLEDLEGMVWRNIGDEKCRNCDEAELKKVWRECGMNASVTLAHRGRIYYCARSLAADELECYPNPKPEEYVDVRNTTVEELADKIEKFYGLEYISTCNYCDGLVAGSPIVPTAAQIVPKAIALELLQYEVQLKEGMQEDEVILAWLNIVRENYKQLIYENGFEHMLSYILNEYRNVKDASLSAEVKKEIMKLWTDFNRNIFQCYEFDIVDMTQKINQDSGELPKKQGRNTISIVVIENEQDWQSDMQNTDIVLTLNDIDNKDYSIVQQAFGV
ncbi:MAG: glycosyltransferase [Lachnospiraceae bacterium]|nr:glycosyltransferase [Lachnospiraceae bacterium]